MRPAAYYNEIDPYCAEWLRNLIAAGEIPAGEVDERPIEEVTADDVRPYTQCHFFAGIGGWAFAARLAGWRDTDPIWTGSCPCQPFSAAGKRLADRDPRNLWPVFARLIAECRPARIAGEQVASKAGRLWLAGVREDLEALGYAVGAADLCAAGVGAPHIRQRLWWVVDAECCDGQQECANAGRRGEGGETQRLDERSGCYGARNGGVPDSDGRDSSAERQQRSGQQRLHAQDGTRFWEASEWTGCADGRHRRIKPGVAPLVTRLPGHVEQVRAYGNSIVPQEAAEVLIAFTEARQTGGVHGD